MPRIADLDTDLDPPPDDENASAELWSLDYATPALTPPQNVVREFGKFLFGLLGGLSASAIVYYNVWCRGLTREHILLAGSLLFIIKVWLIVTITTHRPSLSSIASGLLWSMVSIGAGVGAVAIRRLYGA